MLSLSAELEGGRSELARSWFDKAPSLSGPKATEK